MTKKKGQKSRYWPRIRSERLKTKQKDISRFDSRPAPDENESYKSQKFFSKSSRGNECCPSHLFPRWTADDAARILFIFFSTIFPATLFRGVIRTHVSRVAPNQRDLWKDALLTELHGKLVSQVDQLGQFIFIVNENSMNVEQEIDSAVYCSGLSNALEKLIKTSFKAENLSRNE